MEDWWIGGLAGVSLGLIIGALMEQANSKTFDGRTSKGQAFTSPGNEPHR